MGSIHEYVLCVYGHTARGIHTYQVYTVLLCIKNTSVPHGALGINRIYKAKGPVLALA